MSSSVAKSDLSTINDNNKVAETVKPAERAGQKPTKSKMCKFFRSNQGCRKGAQCAFKHPGHSGASTPPKSNDDGKPKYPSLKLKDKYPLQELEKLREDSPIRLVNGRNKNAHRKEAANRALSLYGLLGKMEQEGNSVLDVQGKKRVTAWTADKTPMDYPEICRRIITNRDAVDAQLGVYIPCTKTSRCARCRGDFEPDVIMSVDVLQHLTPEQVCDYASQGKKRLFYCIYSDSMGYGQVVNSQVLRERPDHFDRQPDKPLFWLEQGSMRFSEHEGIYSQDEEGELELTWRETLSTYGHMHTLVFALGDVPVDATIIDVDSTRAYLMRKPAVSGIYQCTDVRLEVRGGFYSWDGQTFSREEYDFCRDKLAGNRIAENQLQSLAKALKFRQMCADLTLIEQAIRDYIESENRYKMTWSDKIHDYIFTPSQDDVIHRFNKGIAMTQPVGKPRQWNVSLKSVASLMKAMPAFVGSIPIMLACMLYLRHFIKSRIAPPKTLLGTVKSKAKGFALWTATQPQRALPSRVNTGYSMIQLLAKFTGIATHPQLVGRFDRWGSGSNFAAQFGVSVAAVLEETVKTAVSYGVGRVVGSPMLLLGGYEIDFNRLVGSVCFGLWEFASTADRFNWKQRAQALALHVGVGFMSTLPAIVTHTAWNLWSLHSFYENLGPVKPYDGTTGPTSKIDPVLGYECTNEFKPMDDECHISLIAPSRTKGTAGMSIDYVSKSQRLKMHTDRPSKMYPYLIVGNRRPSLPNNSPNNLMVGMRNRVLHRRDHEPRPGAWEYVTKVMENSGLMPPKAPIDPYTMAEYVLCLQDKTKKTRAIANLAKILKEDINERIPTSRDVATEPFIKNEFMHAGKGALFDHDALEGSSSLHNKDPRIISGPANEDIKTITGPTVRALYKEFVNHWDGRNLSSEPGVYKGIWLMSGRDTETISPAEAMSRVKSKAEKLLKDAIYGYLICISGDDNYLVLALGGKLYYFDSDGHRWDSTIREDALTSEFTLLSPYYQLCQPTRLGLKIGIPEFDELVETYGPGAEIVLPTQVMLFMIEQCGSVETGTLDFACDFHREGLRMIARAIAMRLSGSQNTTLGNGVNNASASVTFCESIITRFLAGEFGTLSNPAKGVWQALRKDWQLHWKNLGIKAEVHVYKTPTGGEFCSLRYYPVGNTVYPIPKIGKYLLRMGWSRSKPKSVAQARGVMNQFYPFRNVPFLGPVIKRCCLLLNVPELKGVLSEDDKYKPFNDVTFIVPEPDSSSWKWIEETYGMTKSDHKVWEAMVNQVFELPWTIDYDFIIPLLALDC